MSSRTPYSKLDGTTPVGPQITLKTLIFGAFIVTILVIGALAYHWAQSANSKLDSLLPVFSSGETSRSEERRVGKECRL